MEPMADLITAWLSEKGAALWLSMLGRPRQGLLSLRCTQVKQALD
jgi:hypothetical protein